MQNFDAQAKLILNSLHYLKYYSQTRSIRVLLLNLRYPGGHVEWAWPCLKVESRFMRCAQKLEMPQYDTQEVEGYFREL